MAKTGTAWLLLERGIIALALAASACHPRPVEEMTLADVAVKAAQKVKADALAPDTFRKAENNYLRAKKDFSEGYFDSSRKFAHDARILAEQAEFQALRKQALLKGKADDDAGAPPPGDAGTPLPPGAAPPGIAAPPGAPPMDMPPPPPGAPNR